MKMWSEITTKIQAGWNSSMPVQTGWGTLELGVVGEAEMGLGHAHRQVAEALSRVPVDLLLRRRCRGEMHGRRGHGEDEGAGKEIKDCKIGHGKIRGKER
jgi:hypothetical protein